MALTKQTRLGRWLRVQRRLLPQRELHIWAYMMEGSTNSHKLSLDLDVRAKACTHAAPSPPKRNGIQFFFQNNQNKEGISDIIELPSLIIYHLF